MPPNPRIGGGGISKILVYRLFGVVYVIVGFDVTKLDGGRLIDGLGESLRACVGSWGVRKRDQDLNMIVVGFRLDQTALDPKTTHSDWLTVHWPRVAEWKPRGTAPICR